MLSSLPFLKPKPLLKLYLALILMEDPSELISHLMLLPLKNKEDLVEEEAVEEVDLVIEVEEEAEEVDLVIEAEEVDSVTEAEEVAEEEAEEASTTQQLLLIREALLDSQDKRRNCDPYVGVFIYLFIRPLQMS